jgi:hypothetical protein
MIPLAPLNFFVLVTKSVYVSSRASINTAQHKENCIRYRNDSSHDCLPPGAEIMHYVTGDGGEELKPKYLLSIERLRPICAFSAPQYSRRIRDQLSLEPDTHSYCLDISSLTVVATSKQPLLGQKTRKTSTSEYSNEHDIAIYEQAQPIPQALHLLLTLTYQFYTYTCSDSTTRLCRLGKYKWHSHERTRNIRCERREHGAKSATLECHRYRRRNCRSIYLCK